VDTVTRVAPKELEGVHPHARARERSPTSATGCVLESEQNVAKIARFKFCLE
jgi:hypothetical protein